MNDTSFIIAPFKKPEGKHFIYKYNKALDTLQPLIFPESFSSTYHSITYNQKIKQHFYIHQQQESCHY